MKGNTTYLFLAEATSSVLEHSLTGTVTTAGSFFLLRAQLNGLADRFFLLDFTAAIIIAVGKPFMGKLADFLGRGETYVVVALLYMVGYIVIATANTVNQIAAGDMCVLSLSLSPHDPLSVIPDDTSCSSRSIYSLGYT